MRISDWSSDVCSSDLGSSILFNLLHRPPRFDACKRAAGQGVRRARMIVLDFAEQPVLILFAGLSFHSDEQPFALHPFPMQNEMEMSFLKVFCALALEIGRAHV